MARILLIDDEPALLSTIGYSLRKEGHEVLTAADGERGLDAARRERPDLIILDLLLPRLDGLEVCRALRQSAAAALRTVPILMLTAKADEVDKVVGLEVGADDYVTKPFSMRELVARVKAMLRRRQFEREAPPAETPICIGSLVLDPAERRLLRKRKEIALKPKEFDLIAFFMHHPGQVFSREQLLDHVWGRDFIGDSRTVDVHVRWLREKLEKHPSKPKLLETVRGVGYRLRLPDPPRKPVVGTKAGQQANGPAGARQRMRRTTGEDTSE